jgi:hyperosmotically inducible periplasmic protein
MQSLLIRRLFYYHYVNQGKFFSLIITLAYILLTFIFLLLNKFFTHNTKKHFMNLKQSVLAFAIVAGLATGMISCKSQEKKDAAAKAKIEALVPGVSVEVKDGVATLSGEMDSDAAKAAAADAAKGVEGVKSVVNNTTIHEAPAPAPVVINPDEALITASMAVLKEYPGVVSQVKDGVITLTGEIKKADWMKLKPALDALRPKKVENKMTIK